MKNNIALGLAALVALTNVKVNAGDREWATVGKVLTGVAALHVVERIICPPQPQVVYVHQPVVVQSAPVVHYVPAPQVVYVPSPQVVYVQSPQVVYVPQPVYYHQPAPVVVVHGHYHGHWHRR
jgi:hypothetical protein